jgi:hypothetical protein
MIPVLFLLNFFSVSGQTANEFSMLDEINRLRSNPQSYIAVFDSIKQSYLFNYQVMTEGMNFDSISSGEMKDLLVIDSIFCPVADACDEVIAYLSKAEVVPVLSLDLGLYDAQLRYDYASCYCRMHDQIHFTSLYGQEIISTERNIKDAIREILFENVFYLRSRTGQNDMEHNSVKRTHLLNPAHSRISVHEVNLQENPLCWVLGFN